ncbi:hypothetical protein EJB05_25017, partial [Eragrostis curvula]
MTKNALERLGGMFCCHAPEQEGREEAAAAAAQVSSFRFEVLEAATERFSESRILGRGGFGTVYRGRLDDGRDVAVKQLILPTAVWQFENEARLLSRVKHRNLVGLLGFCTHGDSERLLVYEYIPKQSLAKLLSSADGRAELSWPRRHAVVIGVARGLVYLHEDAPVRIIHRDIKAANVLLDDRWVPKIADFGIARLFPEASEGCSTVKTAAMGTRGYMAPEYLIHHHLSTKADIYSFGVLMLEVISGCKSHTFVPPPDAESDNLLLHAWTLHKEGRSLELLDPAAQSSATPEQVELFVHIGLLCVQVEPHQRPDTKTLLFMLSTNQGTLEEPARPEFPMLQYMLRRGAPLTFHTSASTFNSPRALQASSSGVIRPSPSSMASTRPPPASSSRRQG